MTQPAIEISASESKESRRIRDHLLRQQRLEQSGFTPGKSTIDRILALRVIVYRRREFGRGLLAAYIDLKKFDMEHRESLWEILRLRGIPTRIIGLIASVTDLDFADYVTIESLESLVVALDAFSNEMKPLGLEVSWTKTKIQDFGDLLGEPGRVVCACGEDTEVTESFTYLGSVLVPDHGILLSLFETALGGGGLWDDPGSRGLDISIKPEELDMGLAVCHEGSSQVQAEWMRLCAPVGDFALGIQALRILLHGYGLLGFCFGGYGLLGFCFRDTGF
ncbi:uncharacterized protein [Penaeus vannamei]|uniref:uncharacterized protein n=1 Tax=Penaeus vannamei TaxID=6689 RepID=UPI00387F8817